MPNGLNTENMSMPRVTPPRSRQHNVAVRIFFLAATRSRSSELLLLILVLPLPPFAAAVVVLAMPEAAKPF